MLAKITPIGMRTSTHSSELVIVEPKIHVIKTGPTHPATSFVIGCCLNLYSASTVIRRASEKNLVSSISSDFFLIQQIK